MIMSQPFVSQGRSLSGGGSGVCGHKPRTAIFITAVQVL